MKTLIIFSALLLAAVAHADYADPHAFNGLYNTETNEWDTSSLSKDRVRHDDQQVLIQQPSVGDSEDREIYDFSELD